MSSENKAVQIVSDFLAASMAPDPVKAATYMSSDVRITFTGGRVMPSATEITAFNAARYNWVKKELGQFDWTEHADHTVVARSTVNGPMAVASAVTAIWIGLRYETARSRVWMSGMTAPSGFSRPRSPNPNAAAR